MSAPDTLQRTVLPIPDQPPVGLTTYDAKDPDTKYPPIRAIAAARRGAKRAHRAYRRCRLRLIQRLWRPMSHPELRKTRRQRSQVHPVPHDRAVFADASGLLTGRNHHSVGMGGITEIATSAPGYNSIMPNTSSPLARDPQAEWLFDGTVWQVPRGASLADEPHGSVRSWPSGGGGFEYFYGFIGGETNQ